MGWAPVSHGELNMPCSQIYGGGKRGSKQAFFPISNADRIAQGTKKENGSSSILSQKGI